MKRKVRIGGTPVGDGAPVYVVAEIGINHNGDLDTAKRLIDAAKDAGCNAVKFQKRTPEKCVPRGHKDLRRETPWGYITYLEYRKRIEFGYGAYRKIERYCRKKGIDWFVSCWDKDSVDFMDRFDPICYKIASPCLTDDALLRHVKKRRRPVILSTGMSTMKEIRKAVSVIEPGRLIIAHSTSVYPCMASELNLQMIATLKKRFPCPVGYSGHEVGLQTTYAAVSLGACYVERHITLNRAMWGTDQASSVEPEGFARLIRDIRVIEDAMGDGAKVVYDREKISIDKLRLK